ncbi:MULTISPECIES: hypothetical protein [unclassified Acinetobacter]|nr:MULTISPECIES: hypothetical protein [unclassified Acinetobacter]
MSKQRPVNKAEKNRRRQYLIMSAIVLSCAFLLKRDSATTKK